MKNKKILAGVGCLCILAISVLSSCNGSENPLLQGDREKTVEFLIVASIKAEKEVKIFQKSIAGSYYGECAQGKGLAVVCDEIFKTILEECKKTKAYESITLKDLKDKRAFERLEKTYNKILREKY